MNRPLTALFLAMTLTLACDYEPEPTAKAESALNGFSVPPPGGWGTEPWTCSGPVGSHPAWVPTNHPWPIDTTNGWCQWMPATTTSLLPWNTDECWAPGPTAPGSMDIYSGDNFTGSCARIYSNHDGSAYQWDADLIEVNGWHSIWTPPGKTQQFVGIKSIKIGPHTNVLLCTGPFTGPAGAPCNLYPFQGYSTTTVAVSYPHMLTSGGLYLETAAIQLQATQ